MQPASHEKEREERKKRGKENPKRGLSLENKKEKKGRDDALFLKALKRGRGEGEKGKGGGGGKKPETRVIGKEKGERGGRRAFPLCRGREKRG